MNETFATFRIKNNHNTPTPLEKDDYIPLTVILIQKSISSEQTVK